MKFQFLLATSSFFIFSLNFGMEKNELIIQDYSKLKTKEQEVSAILTGLDIQESVDILSNLEELVNTRNKKTIHAFLSEKYFSLNSDKCDNFFVCCELLKQATGKDNPVIDDQGNTILHLLVRNSKLSILKEFLSRFPLADVNIPNKRRETPYSLAMNGHLKMKYYMDSLGNKKIEPTATLKVAGDIDFDDWGYEKSITFLESCFEAAVNKESPSIHIARHNCGLLIVNFLESKHGTLDLNDKIFNVKSRKISFLEFMAHVNSLRAFECLEDMPDIWIEADTFMSVYHILNENRRSKALRLLTSSQKLKSRLEVDERVGAILRLFKPHNDRKRKKQKISDQKC